MKFFKYVLALAAFGLITTSSSLQAQSASAAPVDVKMVDKTPSFQGGKEAMTDFITKALVYPEPCRKNKTEAIIPVEFTVQADGRITDAKNIGDPEIDNRLIAEAVKVVLAMPTWNPAEYKGNKVACKMVLPIEFKL